MGNQEINKVIDKIRKCLALATSSNEHEAQRAAQKAHELLIRHNLSMQQIEQKEEEYVEKAVDRKIFPKAYEKFIHAILMEYFFVKIFISKTINDNFLKTNDKPSWYDRITFILGTESNVQIASYVRSFLIQKFYELWLDYKRRTSAPPRQEQSYYFGLYEGLCEKLASQKSYIENEMGLTIISDPKLEELTKHVQTKKNKPVKIDPFSYNDGIEDGKKIKIQRGITEKSKDNNKYIGE